MLGISSWENFYVIVGSAAGALIGLQFVVMTLVAERPPARVREAGAAFSTPTIVHFSVVLALAAILCMPWPAAVFPALVCALIGLSGVFYVMIVAWRMRSVQAVYAPDGEDWMFHAAVPLLAYALLASGAIAALLFPREAEFAVAAAALLLLFTGIHNSWDAVAFHVAAKARERNTDNS